MSNIKTAPSGTLFNLLTNTFDIDGYRKRPRPSFMTNSADDTQLIIPGSVSSPAVVRLSDGYHVNTSDLYLDINFNGRRGMDRGSAAGNTLYYLYAIQPTSGTGFDAILSDLAPSTGPVTTPDWSYLGSVVTVNTANLAHCISMEGTIHLETNGANVDVTASEATLTEKTLLIPSSAKWTILRAVWNAVNAIGDNFQTAVSSTGTNLIRHRAVSATAANNSVMYFTQPIIVPTKVWTICTSAADTVFLRVMGWSERLDDYP